MIQEYQTQNELNPKLWDGDQLKPGLRLKLLKIARYFYEFLGIDAPIKSVILTGSNVNYNWTDTSDIDLHVLINYKDVGDSIPLVRDYMMAKKSIWNNTYPLQYKDMPIELYAQDENEPHASTGVYCLIKNEWVKKPSPEQISVDDVEIDKKADPYKFEIDNLNADDPQIEMKIKSLKRRLKRMRQTGLEASGEYSVENLAFKSLRNSGHLNKLNDLQQTNVMSSLAITEARNESLDTIHMDVPLFIRMLEYAREEAKTDMDLHEVTQNILNLSLSTDVLSMKNYNDIVSLSSDDSIDETYADSGLGKWFKEKWVRFDTKGKIKGDCARDDGEGKPKCLPKSKAQSMSKSERSKSASRKRREDPVADRKGKGNKPVNVKTEEMDLFLEKNVANDSSKWSYAKSQAKKKFDVYPSAYANAWASKKYKELGGTWRKSNK